jgi:hypothetical protein
MSARYSLAALGNWTLIAVICANYLGASFELVATTTVIASSIAALIWLKGPVLTNLALTAGPFILLLAAPTSSLRTLPPAARLLAGSGILLLIFSLTFTIFALVGKRWSSTAAPPKEANQPEQPNP